MYLAYKYESEFDDAYEYEDEMLEKDEVPVEEQAPLPCPVTDADPIFPNRKQSLKDSGSGSDLEQDIYESPMRRNTSSGRNSDSGTFLSFSAISSCVMTWFALLFRECTVLINYYIHSVIYYAQKSGIFKH